MNALKIFSSPKFGQVRIITDASGELLFCANDVTDALGYSNGRDAISKHVDEGDVAKRDMGVKTGKRADGTDAFQKVSTTFITEGGVYSLIFSSKLERAKEFKRWVTSEVLPSIRQTGKYSVNQEPLENQLNAKIAFVEWSAKFLNLNAASRLLMAQRIGKLVGMEDTVPNNVNAGTEAPTVHAAKDLLEKYHVGLSPRAFNKVLEIKGVVKQAERKGLNGKVYHWMVLQPAFDKYGQNQQNKDHQQQSQIRWYDNHFPELLTIVGLNRQQSLNLN